MQFKQLPLHEQTLYKEHRCSKCNCLPERALVAPAGHTPLALEGSLRYAALMEEYQEAMRRITRPVKT